MPDPADRINRANGVLAAIPEVSDLNGTDAAVYEGAARFIRAVYYMRLVQWFDGVPPVLKPSKGVGEESLVNRSTKEEVFAQIILDLQEAANLLPAAKDPGKATKGAANALLARVYPEDGKYAEARDKATAVISDPNYSLVDDFASLLTTKHSAESIYEIHFTSSTTPMGLPTPVGMRPSASDPPAAGRTSTSMPGFQQGMTT